VNVDRTPDEDQNLRPSGREEAHKQVREQAETDSQSDGKFNEELADNKALKWETKPVNKKTIPQLADPIDMSLFVREWKRSTEY
jgi:hypothetical protein